MGGKRLTVDDFHRVAARRGIEWIGDPAELRCMVKTLWRCPEGHEWEASYNNVSKQNSSGNGCRICAYKLVTSMLQHTAQDYHNLAASRGYKWLGDIVPRSLDKTEWACSKGHRFAMCYNSIQNQRQGCPKCANVRRNNGTRLKDDAYERLAESRGFTWLGLSVSNVGTKTLWKCQKGHVWQAPYATIYSGHGCPFCGAERANDFHRKSVDDYHAVADAHGLEWLGDLPATTKRRTLWKCHEGHTFSTSYQSIHNGHGCHKCRRIANGVLASTQQFALHTMLGGEINHRVGRFAVDIALNVDGVKVAVEYDCYYWHRGMENREARRLEYLLARGWRVLRIKAGKELPSRLQVDASIALLLSGELYTEILLDWRD